MKKYLLPVLIAILLSSCGKTTSSGDQESKEIIESSSEPTSEIISSSEEIISSSEVTLSSELVSSSEETTTSSTPPDPVGVFEKTLTFYNGGFTGSLDLDNSRADFKDWCNQDGDIFDSINCEGYAQVNYIGNQGDANRFSTLILGSQSKTGKLVFNLSVYAIKVKITVQPYTKYIAYNNTYNVDTHASISINNEGHDLYLETGYTGSTENKEFEYLSVDGTKTISIANKEEGQRVFVHSMEITYWG